jgi:hypothetical protein
LHSWQGESYLLFFQQQSNEVGRKATIMLAHVSYHLADSQQSGQRIVKDINSVHNPITLHQFGNLIGVVIILVLLLPLVLTLLDYLDYRRLQKIKLTYLEITPPSAGSKSAHANNQLFNVLHGLYSIRTLSDCLLRHKQFISLEVVSSREAGIRYIAAVPATSAMAFQQTVTSYLPHVQFKEVPDYITANGRHKGYMQLLEFRLWRHFARPLKSHDALAQHDPISFIANSLAKPEPGELLVMQLVLTPADPREARKVHNKLVMGKEPGTMEWSWKLPFILFLKLLKLTFKLFGGIVWFFMDLFYSEGPTPYRQYQQYSQRPNTKAMQEIDDRMLGKLKQPLFRTNVRAFILMQDSQRLDERTNGLLGSLASYSDPGYQMLRPTRQFIVGRNKKFQMYTLKKFTQRMPSIFRTNRCLLSAEEVANIFHFPYGNNGQTENLVTSFSKTLAAPVAVKQHADNETFDVLFGVNKHHGSETAIGLTAAERQRHVYVIGGTGNGKTTLLQYGLVQDIKNGKGVAIIDPHGDLAESLLRHIPEERMQDIIYFNPRDIAHPIGLNLLEQPEGLSADELLLEQDFITESVVSVFRKIFSEDDSGGHRIEHFLRNAIHTAFTVPDATLFTVYKLLTNTKFRNSVTRKLTDDDLIDFWKGEFNKAGDYQKVKMSSGVTAKLGRFQRSAVSRRILEQPKSTIDFDDIIQNNKILICNFSQGHIGEDTSTLLGISVMTKLQLAALRRSRLGQTERTPFYLYVDEFQNFATQSFVQLLSEARKYKLFLTMAEQSTAQQEERRFIDIILANVGTVICFRSGSPVDEQLLLPLFSPYVQKGEIANLSAYNFYAKLSGMRAQEPMSGETVVTPENDASDERAAKVVTKSRERWSIVYESQEIEPIKETRKKSNRRKG